MELYGEQTSGLMRGLDSLLNGMRVTLFCPYAAFPTLLPTSTILLFLQEPEGARPQASVLPPPLPKKTMLRPSPLSPLQNNVERHSGLRIDCLHANRKRSFAATNNIVFWGEGGVCMGGGSVGRGRREG